MLIEACTSADLDDWARLRRRLWPSYSIEQHRCNCADMLARGHDRVAFIAKIEGEVVGFAEASMRHDYVNGCDTTPVGFLEGIYVAPETRRRGVARKLVDTVKQWTLERNCSELGSDALLDNHASHQMHNALGFEETERVVYFRQTLRQ